jgi:hypothetical protein
MLKKITPTAIFLILTLSFGAFVPNVTANELPSTAQIEIQSLVIDLEKYLPTCGNEGGIGDTLTCTELTVILDWLKTF